MAVTMLCARWLYHVFYQDSDLGVGGAVPDCQIRRHSQVELSEIYCPEGS